MKKQLITLIFLLTILPSCEQDIQLNAPLEFIPVVYCLLNPNTDVQTLRISRVFNDEENLSKWESSQFSDPDNLSFEAYLEHIDEAGNRTIWQFHYVKNLTSPADSKFVHSQIYEASFRPDLSTLYQIYVYFPDIKKMVQASTRTISNISIIDPLVVPGREMIILPNEPYTLRWSGGGTTSYFQGIFKLNYLEKQEGEVRSKSINLVMRPVLVGPDEGHYNQNLTGNFLLKCLREQVPVNVDVIRKITTVDFSLFYGGAELSLYTQTEVNPNGSMGMANDYSNLVNGRGVFSSLSSKSVYNLFLAEQTVDTIANNQLTKPLNFLRYGEDF